PSARPHRDPDMDSDAHDLDRRLVGRGGAGVQDNRDGAGTARQSRKAQTPARCDRRSDVMDPATLSLLVSFAILAVLLTLGVHIGATLALAGIVGTYVFLGNWTAGLNMVFIQSVDVSSSYTLMVIPLFIVLGSLASATGIAGELFTLFYRWFGRVRGGVAIATIGTCAGMASITGSSVATSAAMSRI